jgi:hypothetical protein
MAKKLYEESNIYDIACALREKCGDNNAKYKTCDMADAIRNLSTSGGEGGIPLPFVVSGNAAYRFSYLGWNDFIKAYPIVTENLGNVSRMFYYNSAIEEIPFDINIGSDGSGALTSTFAECKALKAAPQINSVVAITDMWSAFSNCNNLKELPENFMANCTWDLISDSKHFNNVFYYCYSLRELPMEIFANDNPLATASNSYFNYSWCRLYAVDEMANMPIPYIGTWTSNAFNYNTHFACRMKRFTFATNNGTPFVRNWSNQNIGLSNYVGYADSADNILNYSSGCTEDTRVTDAASYAALKDHPDYWTTDIAYSRYNHDSAVETINSLPDCSAAGSNTVTFMGDSGSATDGGAINTLTETEIAVATAKGWTIAFQ